MLIQKGYYKYHIKMNVKRFLLVFLFTSFFLFTGAVEYGDYQELRYEENGFTLLESGPEKIVVNWQAPEEVSYDKNFRVLLALPHDEYEVDIIDYKADIYSRQEYVQTINKGEESRYALGFWHHRSDFLQVLGKGWFRAVYPLGVNIQPYRNINFRQQNKDPVQFQAIIRSITLQVNFPRKENTSDNYLEAQSFRKVYQLLFLNNDYIDYFLFDPRNNPAFDFEDVSWAPSFVPDDQFFKITVYRTGINRIMGYELYKHWGEDFYDIDPSNFYVKYKGEKIPIYVQTCPDNTFRLEDYILFYGYKADLDNIYTTRGEYFLGYGSGRHPRWRTISHERRRRSPASLVPAKEVFTTRSYHARQDWNPSLNIEDGWYWLEVPHGSRRHLEFEVPDFVTRLPVRAQEDAVIRFKVYLAYQQETEPRSILQDKMYVNDTAITLEEENIHDGYIEFSVPFRGVIRPRQTNRLVFESTGNVPKNIYVDRFYVTYCALVTVEQNYLEFETVWDRNSFQFEKPNTNFFLFHSDIQSLYPMEGKKDFLYDFSYPLPESLEKYGIDRISVLSTGKSHRYETSRSFLYIDDKTWQEDRKGVYFITYDPAEERFVQTIRMSPDMSDERIIHLDNRLFQAIRNLPEDRKMFVVTAGDYLGNPLFRSTMRSRFQQMGIEKPVQEFYENPFSIFYYRDKEGEPAAELFTYDKPHEFKDDLFLVFGPDIDRSIQTYNFVHQFPNDEQLIFGQVSGFKKVSVNKVQDNSLRKKDRQIDYVIITHPEFKETLEPFVDFLEKEKHFSVEVANIFEIYNEFSYGSLDPAAINRYLRYLFRNNAAPLPEYVLLVGDANIDYRNFYNTTVRTYVPSYRSQDDPLADANENFFSRLSDGLLNDVHLGRWPVHALDQLRHIIDKTIEQHTQQFSYDDLEWLNRLTFLIDNGYESEAEYALGKGVPREFFMEPLYLRHFPLKDNRMYPLNQRNIQNRRKRSPECTEAVLENLNRGTSFFFYLGHGGPNLFSHQRIILGGGTPRSDVRLLENEGRYFFMIVMSCLNGFFDYHSPPWNHSISADFLTRPRAGASAIFAPSGKGVVFWQQELSRSLFNALFSPYDLGLGESITAGRTFFQLSRGDQVTDDMYVFLGDPSLQTVYPKLNTSIEMGELQHSRPVEMSGTIQRPNRETYNRQLEYSPVSAFNGKGKLIFYNEANHEIYRRENITVEKGQWSTSVLLPKVDLQKIIVRALFVNKNGEQVALGENLANGYIEMDIEPDPDRARRFIDLLSFWNRKGEIEQIDTADTEQTARGVDFQIRDIRLSNETLAAGNSAYVKVRIKNNSPQSFSRVLVRSYYAFPANSDIPFDSEELRWINMRSQSSWSYHQSLEFEPFEEKIIVFKLDPETIYGSCYFKVTINEHEIIEEICYENNRAYASLRYLMRPDLAVEDITVAGMDRNASKIQLEVKIANHGEMAAEEFFISYTHNNRNFASRSFIEKLAPGETKTVSVEGTALDREGTIKVVVDPGTGESNRYNGVVFEHLEPVNRYQENNVMLAHYSYEEESLRTSRLE